MNSQPVDLYDYKTIVDKNKHSRHATNTFVTAAQRKSILTSLDDACFILFSYYMERAHTEGFDFKDARAAKALGYDTQKVKRARLKLIKHGWFYQSLYKNCKGRKVVLTFLGRTVVAEYKRTGDILRITRTNTK